MSAAATTENLLDSLKDLVVFERQAPFGDSYERHYVDALRRGDIALLDFHREAIYYLEPNAVWAVISVLIIRAGDCPTASFVESLGCYLTMPENFERFSNSLRSNGGLIPMLAAIAAKVSRELQMEAPEVSEEFRVLSRQISNIRPTHGL